MLSPVNSPSPSSWSPRSPSSPYCSFSPNDGFFGFLGSNSQESGDWSPTITVDVVGPLASRLSDEAEIVRNPNAKCVNHADGYDMCCTACWLVSTREMIPCKHGAGCRNLYCTYGHPRGWKPTVCLYGDQCHKPDCRLEHPSGNDRTGLRRLCHRYHICKNSECPFKHAKPGEHTPDCPHVRSDGQSSCTREHCDLFHAGDGYSRRKACKMFWTCRVRGCTFQHADPGRVRGTPPCPNGIECKGTCELGGHDQLSRTDRPPMKPLPTAPIEYEIQMPPAIGSPRTEVVHGRRQGRSILSE